MLQDRVAIITGAGRGIGREHALLFASLGAKVVVNDLGGAVDGSGADVSAAQSVVDEITAAGGQAVANTDSVSSFDGAKAMVDQAVSTFGDLHVVVNNAGILRDRMLVSMSEQEFDDVIAVHLKGTFNLTRHAAGYWRDAAKAGTITDRAIVNTSSGAGLHGNVGQTNYSAAKAGIAAMTVVNAMELNRYGVRANCIAPVARTRLTLQTPGDGRVDAAAPVRPRERLAARRRAGLGDLPVQRPGLQRLRRVGRDLRRLVHRRLGRHRRPLDGRDPGRRPWTSCPARSRSTARSPSSSSTWGADRWPSRGRGRRRLRRLDAMGGDERAGVSGRRGAARVGRPAPPPTSIPLLCAVAHRHGRPLAAAGGLRAGPGASCSSRAAASTPEQEDGRAGWPPPRSWPTRRPARPTTR